MRGTDPVTSIGSQPWESYQHTAKRSLDKRRWLELDRRVRFGDTDAAGVMHFHQLMRWCHEAWEESLERYGIAAADVFPGGRRAEATPAIALPVVHCEADFLKAVHGGDELVVKLEPERLNPGSFELRSTFLLKQTETIVARGLIRHLAIDVASRRRCNLPEGVDRWLEASGLGEIRAL